MSERLRLVFLVNSLAPYGAETFILNHARHASRDRFDITVCYFGGSDALSAKMRACGARVVSLEEHRRPSANAAKRLAEVLRRERADILQTHIGYSGVMGRLVGRAVGVPAVVSTEQTVRTDYRLPIRVANDATFHLAHANVFISRAVLASFRATFQRRLRHEQIIITNGIDTEAIGREAREARASMRAELGVPEGDFAFGNVGRLTVKKGQRFAIDALARVRRHHPNASLWIVGGGELENDLLERARAAGVAESVHLLGQRLDVHRVLGAFDAYVHPATTEGLGIAVLEAMAAGLPTIASRVDGLPEFVRAGETGWLSTSEDVDDLAAQMTSVLEDRVSAARIAQAGRALIQREHDIRGSVRAYETLYLDLLHVSRGAQAANA